MLTVIQAIVISIRFNLLCSVVSGAFTELMFIFPSENIIHQHSYGNLGMPCDNCTFTPNTTRETSLIVHAILYKLLLSRNSNYDVFFLDLILRRQST